MGLVIFAQWDPLRAAAGSYAFGALRRLILDLQDTLTAVRAYEHYLGLRPERPSHPPWAAEWDSVRAELAALTLGRRDQAEDDERR